MATRNQTNLASEFYVLSMLNRKGATAVLTLGNTKSIDIVVERRGSAVPVDVKGMQSKTNWRVGRYLPTNPRLYFAFVTFLNHMNDHGVAPETYILSSSDVKNLARPDTNGFRIQYSDLRGNTSFFERWDRIT